MILDQNTIEFRGMPLFQRARMEVNDKQLSKMQDLACFFYIVEGKYEAIESNGSFQVGAKEALVKKCGNYVAHFMGDGSGDTCEAVAVYLYPEVLHEVYKNEVPSFLSEDKGVSAPRKMVNNELIDKYINNLFVYFENPSLIDEELALLKLKELVMLLLRSEQFESVQTFLSEIFSPNKLKFTSIVENNIFSNVSVEELAFICGKSLSSFKRSFQELYKETPARYIKNRRLERAAELLRSTNEQVSGIAYECGFQDASTFSASFQEKFGKSPSQYRLA